MSRSNSKIAVSILDELIDDVLKNVVNSFQRLSITESYINENFNARNQNDNERMIVMTELDDDSVSIDYPKDNDQQIESQKNVEIDDAKIEERDSFFESQKDLKSFIKESEELLLEQKLNEEIDEESVEEASIDGSGIEGSEESAFSEAFCGLQLMEQIDKIEEEAENQGVSFENKEFADNLACVNVLSMFMDHDNHNEYDYSEFKKAIQEQKGEEQKETEQDIKQEENKQDQGGEVGTSDTMDIGDVVYGVSFVVFAVAVAVELFTHYFIR